MTIRGLIEYDDMQVLDVVEVGDNYRKIATEYRFQGELVKRDVTVNPLRPFEIQSIEGKLNG